MSIARPYIPHAGRPAHAPPRLPPDRARQLKVWWREIDRTLLGLILALMVIGCLAVAAASPASAARLSTSAVSLSELHFLKLHMLWQFVGLIVLVVASMVPVETARRGAIVLTGLALAALALVPFVGTEVNGARRWLELGVRVQPSEFLKPVFIVTTAWILSWRVRDPQIPVIAVSGFLLAIIIALVMAQPNLGDAILLVAAWFVLVLVAGLPMKRLGIFAGAGAALLIATYLLYDNARHRIDSFLGGGTAFDQVDLASRTLMGGGWTGAGLWLGTEKMRLPEAHTDYVFSVVGEEFGLVTCAVIVLIYLAMILRVLARLLDEERLFIVLAAAGLIALFGGQAFINILVNLQLFPSKGMTLPLVSYGGSSTIAQCFTLGLLLAITRRNPFLSRDRFELSAALGRTQAR